jgi:hypothetical protein
VPSATGGFGVPGLLIVVEFLRPQLDLPHPRPKEKAALAFALIRRAEGVVPIEDGAGKVPYERSKTAGRIQTGRRGLKPSFTVSVFEDIPEMSSNRAQDSLTKSNWWPQRDLFELT